MVVSKFHHTTKLEIEGFQGMRCTRQGFWQVPNTLLQPGKAKTFEILEADGIALLYYGAVIV